MLKPEAWKTALVRSLFELAAVWPVFARAHTLAFDFETAGLEDLTVWGFGLAIAPSADYPKGFAAYFGCEPDCELQWEIDLKPRLEALFANPELEVVGHNLKFDTIVARRAGMRVIPQRICDTMVLSHMLANQEKRHALDAVAKRVLKISVEKGLMAIREFRDADPKLYWLHMHRYGTDDVIMPLLLRDALLPQLEAFGMVRAAQELEMPMVGVTAEMQLHGFALDTAHLQVLAKKLDASAAEHQTEVFAQVGYEFNLASPVQLSAALFEIRDLADPLLTPLPDMVRGKPRGKALTPGAWPTGSKILKTYDVPVTRAVEAYRHDTKLLGTYVLPFIAAAEADSRSRLHVDWKQTGTETGRFSSSPNAQNFPREPGMIRKAVVAEPGFVFGACDYSQIELRLMAHFSGDPAMCEAYDSGQDLHRRTAAFVAKVPEAEVTKHQRQLAKGCNFGFIYGMSATRFQEYARFQYGVMLTMPECEAARAAYFTLYRGVKNYHDSMRDFIFRNGYAENIIGERRFLAGYDSDDSYERWQAWSRGTNYTIQGSAAALIKIAMLNIYNALERPCGHKVSQRYGRVVTLWGSKNNLAHEVRMVMQVHDEVVFEVRAEIAEPFMRWVKHKMETAIQGIRVPIIAEYAPPAQDLEAAKGA